MRIQKINNKINVQFGYNADLVSAVKAIGGGRYDGDTRSWNFELSKIGAVVGALKPLGFEVSAKIADEMNAANNTATKFIELESKLIQAIHYPESRQPYNHQREGVGALLSYKKIDRSFSKILADDMGLGKTFQALVAASAWKRVTGCAVFVIAPASMRDTWMREAAQIGVEIEAFSWGKLPQIPATAKYLLIADEAHYAQAGNKSARGKAFLNLSRADNCVAVYALTGTPMKNGRPQNAWALYYAVRDAVAEDKKNYDLRYCGAHSTRFTKWDVTGATNLAELREKTRASVIRRTKSECLDLPEKIRVIKQAEVSAEAQREYKALIKALLDEFKQRGTLSRAEALITIGVIRRAASLAKCDTAIELADQILENGSVVIFTDFVDSAKKIHTELTALGHKCELLTGDVSSTGVNGELSERQKMVDRFQSGTSTVFVSTIRAGGVGITLTAASDSIMVDRAWTPGDVVQAEDRIHRIGQKQTANVQWLQFGSGDTLIDELLSEKMQNIDTYWRGETSINEADAVDAVQILKDILSK